MISDNRCKITVIAPLFFPSYSGMEQVAGLLTHYWSANHKMMMVVETPPQIHGENIWFTDFDDQERLMNDTLCLIDNPALLNTMRLGAKKLYDECLHWDAVANQYSELLNNG